MDAECYVVEPWDYVVDASPVRVAVPCNDVLLISCYVGPRIVGDRRHPKDECTDIDTRSVGSQSLSSGGVNRGLSDSG